MQKLLTFSTKKFGVSIPRQRRGDIVLSMSVRPSVRPSFRPHRSITK